MKKRLYYLAFLSLILGMTFTSCVSNKKFLASQARVDSLQLDNANTHSNLYECDAQVKKLNEELTSSQNENALVLTHLKNLSSQSKMTIADQAKRLAHLQNIIQTQRDIMTNLQKSIAEALLSYSTDQLSVYIKDGKVYVSLEEQLLFKSGSAVVNPQGKEALKSLAVVLNSTKKITVMIEGHTDSIPMHSKQFEDNWDLSTARATSIVRILTTDYGFDPNRITAAGRSEFQPVLTNETEEGRAANRRTEIILSPDLKELYTLLYQ